MFELRIDNQSFQHMYNMEKTKRAFKYDGNDEEPPKRQNESPKNIGTTQEAATGKQMKTFDFDAFGIPDNVQVKKAVYIGGSSMAAKRASDAQPPPNFFDFGPPPEEKQVNQKNLV